MSGIKTLPMKSAKLLGWQMPPPATMTRDQVIEYFGRRSIYDDVLASGWVAPCGRKAARRSGSGLGRGDTVIFATDDVVKASQRMAREGYPPVSARKVNMKEDGKHEG